MKELDDLNKNHRWNKTMNSGQLLSTWPASMLRLQDKPRGLNVNLYVLANSRIYGMIVGNMLAVLFVCV